MSNYRSTERQGMEDIYNQQLHVTYGVQDGKGWEDMKGVMDGGMVLGQQMGLLEWEAEWVSWIDRRWCSSWYRKGLGCEHSCGWIQWMEKKMVRSKKVKELRGQVVGCEIVKNDNKRNSQEIHWAKGRDDPWMRGDKEEILFVSQTQPCPKPAPPLGKCTTTQSQKLGCHFDFCLELIPHTQSTIKSFWFYLANIS